MYTYTRRGRVQLTPPTRSHRDSVTLPSSHQPPTPPFDRIPLVQERRQLQYCLSVVVPPPRYYSAGSPLGIAAALSPTFSHTSCLCIYTSCPVQTVRLLSVFWGCCIWHIPAHRVFLVLWPGGFLRLPPRTLEAIPRSIYCCASRTTLSPTEPPAPLLGPTPSPATTGPEPVLL